MYVGLTLLCGTAFMVLAILENDPIDQNTEIFH